VTDLAIGVLLAVALVALILLVGNLATGWRKREVARMQLEDRVSRLEGQNVTDESAIPED